MSYQVNTLRPDAPAEGSSARPTPPGRDDAPRHDAPRSGPPRSGTPPAAGRERAKGSMYREQAEWGQVALFAAGIAVGALLGAGAALLTAPQSGIETRLALKRGARKARVRAEDRWDDLGRELRAAARRRKRKLRRKVTASRWRAADAFEA
jgi:hypothetical protein